MTLQTIALATIAGAVWIGWLATRPKPFDANDPHDIEYGHYWECEN